ncbi:MAG: hypothetical protein J6C82_07410 [Clostridia bacterium]|nr:hypothetical protein [Clostridia bacterium]
MNKKPKLSELTLREKISQTAMLSQNAVFDNFTKSESAVKYIADNPIGTFHAMGAGNFGEIHMVDGVAQGFKEKDYAKKYHEWMLELNGASKVPLLIASDCEGGMGFPFPQMTSVTTAGGLGATDDEALAYKKGYQIAKEATYAGLNWLWGPPADLVGRLMYVMINRGYGDGIELNKKMVTAEIKGMQDAGVAATLKHFPGPGTADYRDAHGSVTINPASLEEWEKNQGAIYQAAIDAGVYSVMVGHNAFPAVDDSKIGNVYVPSTLSEKVVTGLLKEKMGFDGVVVTDGIGMRGLSLMYEDRDELHKALIKAGNDVILSVRDIEHYLEMMEEAVLSGEIPESRIDDACQRVLNMKEKLGLFTDEPAEVKDLPEELVAETRRLNREIAEKSMTLICDNDKKIPLSKDKIKKIIVFCPGYDDNVVNRVREVFTREFTARGVEKVEVRHYIDDTKPYEGIDLIPLVEEYDLLIYAPYLPHGWGNSFIGESFRTLAFSMRSGKKKSIAISLGSPYLYFDYFQQADTYINLYSPIEESLVAVVKGLYGELEFTGKNQFELIPDFAK